MSVVPTFRRSRGNHTEAEIHEVRHVCAGPGDDLEVMGLILLRDADLEEALELGPVLAAVGRGLDEGLDIGEAEDRGQARPRHPPMRSLALPVSEADGLEAAYRRRRCRGIQPTHGEGVKVRRGPDPAPRGTVVGPWSRQR